MYFSDDSLLPENQSSLIITAAPYGRLRQAVPRMILQLGGSISFAPPDDNSEAQWQGYDTRHMLAEIDPKPDQVTVAIGSSQWDVTSLTTIDDWPPRLTNPKAMWAFSNMAADALPDFYIEHLKRLREHAIQPHFALAHVHSLEIVDRLIRHGLYMGPVNGSSSVVGGGAAGANPFDWMELIRRTPHGSVFAYQTMMRLSHPLAAFCIALGQHTRAGIGENLWDTAEGKKLTTVQMIEKQVRLAKELGRKIATPEEARRILKIGAWYNSVEERLLNLGLPPNREGGQQGFIGFTTTGGRIHTAQVTGSDGHPVVHAEE